MGRPLRNLPVLSLVLIIGAIGPLNVLVFSLFWLLGAGDNSTRHTPTDARRQQAIAKPSAQAGGVIHLRVAVRLFDEAEVERATLEDAMKIAAVRLLAIGVESLWLGCRLSPQDARNPEGCGLPLSPTDVVLRFIPWPNPAADGSPARGYVLALSAGGASEAAPSAIDGSVGRLVQTERVVAATVLGQAMAEEIRRLILRTGTCGGQVTCPEPRREKSSNAQIDALRTPRCGNVIADCRTL